MSHTLSIRTLLYSVSAVLFGAILALSVPFLSARAATSDQALLESLLAQVALLQAQLNAAGGGVTFDTTCPYFARTLSYGMSGSDVSALQSFLARDASLYPERTVTGFYGPATERAVQRLQYRAGIVMSGSPATTGYGILGPSTRAHIQNNCVITTTPDPDTVDEDIDGDLSVYNLKVDEDNWDVGDNDENELSFDIRNTSDNDLTVTYTVRFEPEDNDNNDPSMTDTVVVGEDDEETITVEFDDTIGFDANGDYEVVVEIDPSDEWDETSESNNERSTDITISGLDRDVTGDDEDDIILSDVELSEDEWDIESGDDNEISFDITNTFGDDEDVEYEITVENDDTGALVQKITGEINVDEGETETIEKELSKNGYAEDDYLITIELDPSDDLDEEDESNNDEDIEFEVTDVSGNTTTVTESLDLKVAGLDTPGIMDPTGTTSVTWTSQGVNSCKLTVNRRPIPTGSFNSVVTPVANSGTENMRVTVAVPQGALTSVRIDCARNSGGTLSDTVVIALSNAIGDYKLFQGATMKEQALGVTQYRAMGLCLRSMIGLANPRCEWNGKVIYGTPYIAVERRIMKGYMGTSATPFITTANATKAEAISNCEVNSKANPGKRVYYFWGAEKVCDMTTPVTTTVQRRTMKGYMGTSETPFIISQNITKAATIRNCEVNSKANPGKRVYYFWGAEKVCDMTTPTSAGMQGTLVAYNGIKEEPYKVLRERTRAQAIAQCITYAAQMPKIWCTWKGEVVYGTRPADAVKKTAKGYMGEATTPFITTPNSTRAETKQNCKVNSEANPGVRVHYFWGTEKVCDMTTPETDGAVLGAATAASVESLEQLIADLMKSVNLHTK